MKHLTPQEKEFKHIWKEVEQFLTEKEREIISLRFGLKDGDNHSFQDIGNKYGFTREYARQVVHVAMHRAKERYLSLTVRDQ